MDFSVLKLALVLLFTSVSCFQEVCVVTDGSSSKPPPYCETTTSLNHFCQSASDVPDHTTVTLLSGTHHLDTICQFNNVKNITLRSETWCNVSVQCNSSVETGFLYLNVSNLVMSSIEIRGCGATWKVPQALPIHSNTTFLAALLVISGADYTLNNVTIISGGVFIYNTAGNVIMNSMKVIGPTVNTASECMRNVILYDARMTLAKLTILDSLIQDLNNTVCSDLIFGGGLSLILGKSSLTLNIVRTNISQNSGIYGGNLGIAFYDSNASVTISNSNFYAGMAAKGGGLYVLTNSNFSSSSLTIVNSQFVNNEGTVAGGGTYITRNSTVLGNATLNIDVINCSFYGNVASSAGGHGIYLFPYVDYSSDFDSEMSLLSASLVNLNLIACNFYNNSEFASDCTVISLYYILLVRMSEIVVESNNCIAIYAQKSNIEFSGSSRINNNTGYSGVGLNLINSQLFFKPNTNLVITNNTAVKTGGGVRVSSVTFCFYGLSSEIVKNCSRELSSEIVKNCSLEQTVNFTVKNNHAQEGGDNIYFENFHYCRKNVHLQAVLHVSENDNNNPSSISSRPLKVCIGGYNDQICYYEYQVCRLYPGEKVSFTDVYLTGASLGLTTGTFSASIAGNASINNDEKAQNIGMNGNNVTFTLYRTSSSNTEKECKLYLEPKDPYDSSSWSQSHTSLIIITFLDCPYGFQLTATIYNSNLFECQSLSIPVIVSSSIETQTITKRNLSWLGMFKVENKSYIAANNYCPLDYCNPTVHEIQSHPDYLNQNEQCQYNRTGVLCGACPEGWSMVLGSSECRECSSVWLLLILPFALAGLLLVFLIHYLNLTVTSGTVCSLIFYANVLQDHSVALLSKYHPIPGLTPLLQVFLSWLNLDLGIVTCFYSGMESFGKTMLLFVFPIYIWFISAGIIILSNRFICFTKLVGRNTVKVLSTLIILSYSKMLRVTIGIFSFKLLTVYKLANSDTEVRWAVDGNIPYLDTQRHLVLFVIAVLFALLLLPFSIALLCIKHAYYLSNCGRVFSWMDKLKPFFETYTGPFKDKARFWTGLLLFVRSFLLIVSTVDYSNSVIPFYFVTATCLLLLGTMIILHGLYKKKILNILEAFFILNICFVFLINTYNRGSELWISILSHLLVSSVFLAFLGIVVYHICLKFNFAKCPCFKQHTVEAEYEEFDYDGMRDEHVYRPLLGKVD